jgi:hypothetical protein
VVLNDVPDALVFHQAIAVHQNVPEADDALEVGDLRSGVVVALVEPAQRLADVSKERSTASRRILSPR